MKPRQNPEVIVTTHSALRRAAVDLLVGALHKARTKDFKAELLEAIRKDAEVRAAIVEVISEANRRRSA